MQTEAFNYDLPEKLIAQHPTAQRDQSRLMVLDKKTGDLTHKGFSDIIDYFQKGDVLVRNITRVLPARLFGEKIGGSAQVEVLLLKRITDKADTWEALVRPGKRLPVGSSIAFGNGDLVAEVIDKTEAGRIITFRYEGIFEEHLERLGTMPLPPYIKEKLHEPERYQTVYAQNNGSAAAPTAGLHFTDDLFLALKNKGVEIVDVLLHVGLGSFKPVSEARIEDHPMHSEYWEISEEAAQKINLAKEEGRRVIAVGTTTTRTLESAAYDGKVRAGSGWTEIFIYPGYTFQIIDGLITNFHLPKSTLIMLVSALAGRENILRAYQVAVQEEYRFFSFGDAMLIC